MSVQANNIYVGARYIPRIMGEYNNETAYEALDIVTSGGVGYISRQPVPAGTAVTNKEYWARWGSGNAAIDALTQRVATNETDITALETGLQQTDQNLQTTNQNLENLVIPWEPASTLKGDGTTDNTLLFGGLDPNTPIALLPGTYLITGNATIPCPVMFIPGAVIKYNAATPGSNYATVTFAKGFYVPDNTQIFDRYIIPKIGGNNTTLSPKFSWYGGKESNNAETNDNIMAWLLSDGFGATEITIEPGTYAMSDMNNGEGNVTIGNHNVVINAYGVTFNSAMKTGNRAIIKGAKFTASSGGVTTRNSSFVECEFTCPVTDSDVNGVLIGALFERCTFSNTVTTDVGTKFRKCDFTVNHGGQAIASTGTDDVVSIKDCVFDLGTNSSATTSIIGGTAAGVMVLEGCRFRKQGNNVPPAFVVDIGSGFAFDNVMTIGKLKANTAINNVAYIIEAENQTGNIINQEIQPPQKQKQIIGYTLTSDNTQAILAHGANVVNFELVELYDDGTYKNLGPIPSPGRVSVIGMHKRVTYKNVGKSIIIDNDEDATMGLVVYHTESTTVGTKGAYAFWQFTVTPGVG